MRNLLVLIVFSALSSPVPYWYEGYYPAVDLSTGCENFPVLDSDGSFSTNRDILAITANTNTRNGVYMGVIAAKEYPREEGTYTLSGEFRKASGDIEQIDANIQWVDENYIEHRAEILWSLNPESPLYGWVWTRGVTDEEILLYKLGDDINWHKFEVVAYHSGDTHLIKSVSIDDKIFVLDLPQGELDKLYNDRLIVLLEVQNKYPACNQLFAFTGVAEFRNVSLQYENPNSGGE